MKLSNVAWNLGGLGIPVLAGLAAIPALLSSIGIERFGVLSLAWGLLGFAGLFDLGIGRATTRSISSAIGKNLITSIPGIVRTSTSLSAKSGAIGTLIFAAAIALGAHTLLTYSSDLEIEIRNAAYILAITIPIQALSAMYRGVNEAFGNFKAISIVRAASTSATFLFPLAVSNYSVNCGWLVLSLLASRLLGLIAYNYLARKEINKCNGKEKSTSDSYDAQNHSDSKELLRFGSWFTLSSILYPAMGQIDRLMIGAKLSVAEVAAYTIPFDLIMQLLVIPGAITTVLFPSIAKLNSQNIQESDHLFFKWLLIAVSIMATVSIIGYLVLPHALYFWLDFSLGGEAVSAARIVILGLIPFTIGTLFIVQVHTKNRPEIPAISHLAQFILFVPLSYFAISHYGLIGAALIWTTRITVDALVLVIWYILARQLSNPQNI